MNATAAAPTVQATTPGTPGVPQAPTVVYAEDFENNTGATPILLPAYVGAPPLNETYTADPAWLSATNCNGIILDQAGGNQPNCQDRNPAGMQTLKNQANVLGQVNGAADPTLNHVVSAFTDGANPGANKVEFQTVNQIPLATTNRFITFSVDVAASSCSASAPLLEFYLTGSGADVPTFTSPINPCTDPRSKSYPSSVGSMIQAGSFPSDGSVLVSDASLGVKMVNANGSGTGNDHAYDNIRILDVTPQLDKAFSPATITEGGTSTLTLTVTNTTDLASKSGFALTDTLPSGVSVAATPNAATTCGAGTVTAAAGGNQLALTGGVLAVGQASCTVSVDVTSPTAGDYVNGPGNTTTTGINPPADTPLTVLSPAPSITKAAAEASFVAGETIHYTYTVTNNASQPLTNLQVTDTGPGTPTVTCPSGPLAPGASVDCTASYTATASDVEAGEIVNTAKVTGTSPGGRTVTATSNKVTVPLRSLTITKSVAETKFTAAGQTLHYTFTVTNNGEVPLTGIAVTDNGPGTPTVTCPSGSLAVGASQDCTATYVTTAADVTAGRVVDTATVTGTAPDGRPGTATSNTVTVPYTTEVDLAVVKTGPATVAEGGKVSYTITVTNNGPDGSTGYTISDPIPAGLNNAATTTAGCAVASGKLTCTGGPLANGASRTISLTGKAAAGTKTIVNKVTVTGKNPDPNPGNNTSTTTTKVTGTPGLTITKKQNGSATVKAGATVKYTITVKNTGTTTYAKDKPASFSDDLTELLDDARYDDNATSSSGKVSYSRPTLKWSGALAPGQSATITFSITTDARTFGDLKLDNTVVSNTPGNNCPAKSKDTRCTTHGKVKAKDKDKRNKANTLGADGSEA
ncbi:hypothetical protein [Streptomyces sp. NPDC050422]|uniref:DUF7507 domain-containing protein n=1 Tax=Streptomyces sp. NPDC050422 TaxID=3365614 RepID=UPI0037A5D174